MVRDPGPSGSSTATATRATSEPTSAATAGVGAHTTSTPARSHSTASWRAAAASPGSTTPSRTSRPAGGWMGWSAPTPYAAAVTPAAGDAVLAMLLVLFEQLRAAGVGVSMSEVLDAADALGHLDLLDRGLLREALAASLVKRHQDRALFDELFDRCFTMAAAPAAVPTGAPPRPGEAAAPGPATNATLVAALRAGDTERQRAIVLAAIDQSGVGTAEASERSLVYRVVRALDLAGLLAAVMRVERAGTPDASALDLRLRRDDVARQLDDLRRLIEAEVRRRRRSAPATAPIEPLRLPDDLDVFRASTVDRRAMRAAVRPLARQLAAARRAAAAPAAPRPARRAPHDAPLAGERRGAPRPVVPAPPRVEGGRRRALRPLGLGGRVRRVHADARARPPPRAGPAALLRLRGRCGRGDRPDRAGRPVPRTPPSAAPPGRRRRRRPQRLRPGLRAVLDRARGDRAHATDDADRDRRRPHQLPCRRRWSRSGSWPSGPAAPTGSTRSRGADWDHGDSRIGDYAALLRRRVRGALPAPAGRRRRSASCGRLSAG